MEELKSLELQLEELNKKIQKAKDKELLSAHIPSNHKEVAEALHKKTCHYNHTDGCGWYYDDGSWTESSRKEYLHKAKVLSTKFNKVEILFFISAL